MKGISEKEKIIEAGKRLKELGLDNDMFINPFIKNQKIFQYETVNISEKLVMSGISFDPDDECKKAINNIKKNKGLPYAAIKSITEFGVLYSILYVSDYFGDWGYERPNECKTIKSYGEKTFFVDSYVYNSTDDILSDYGSILVQNTNGGLVRVG